MEEVQGVKLCFSQEIGFVFETTGEDLSVLDQFCCTVVKGGNLVLQMRQGCIG